MINSGWLNFFYGELMYMNCYVYDCCKNFGIFGF